MDGARLTTRERGRTTSLRRGIAAASGVNVVLGAWLLLAPSVLDYERADPVVALSAPGALVAILALARTTLAWRRSWMSWVNALAGGWVFATGLLVAQSPAATLTGTFTGALIVTFAAASATASSSARRT